VTLTLQATDANGLAEVCFSEDGSTWSDCAPFAQSVAYTFAPTDGLRTVYARLTDVAGNVAQVQDSIVLDTVPPSLSLAINGGAQFTNSAEVTLALTGDDSTSGLESMSFSNDGTTWSLPAAFAASFAWTLSAGDGAKTVHAKLVDRAGNEVSAQATITADLTAPTLTSFSINSGATYTNSLNVTGNNSASDGTGSGLAEICIGTAALPTSCQPYGAAPTATLQGPDGEKTLYARVKDRAGNYSDVLSDAITLDMTPPTITALTLNGGAPYATSRNLVAETTATDAVEIAFSVDDGATWSPWQAWSASTTWQLPATEQAYTVFARVKDRAGNLSAAPHPSDSITLDMTPPSGTVLINFGAEATNDPALVLTLTSDPDTARCIKQTNQAPAPTDACFLAYSPGAYFTVTSTDGQKTVYVWFKDHAGLVGTAASDSIILDTVAPSAVANLTVRPGHRQVELSWDPATDASSGIDQYEVMVSAPTRVMQVEGTSLVVTDLQNGVGQPFRVFAVDKAGNRSAAVMKTSTPRYPFTPKYSLPTSVTLYAANMAVMGETLFVGEGGMMLKSTDLGATFTRIDPRVDTDLRAISMRRSLRRWS
jgi:hypothetical protein